MNLSEFVAEWNGKYCDFDHVYGAQCVDIIQYYERDVIEGPPLTGNAVDIFQTYPKRFYQRIANGPNNFPSPGDIPIWGQDNVAGTGVYGHIAIALHADVDGFVVLGQNWPTNSPCHEQSHNYHGVLGWLHPQVSVTAPARPAPPVHTAAAYAAAAWIAQLDGLTTNVPVAACVARKEAIKAWIASHP